MPQDVAGAFAALGLGRDATRSQVQRAFRARAFACHPDTGGSAAAFRRLLATYRTALEGASADATPAAGSPYAWYERQAGTSRAPGLDVFDSPEIIRPLAPADFETVLARHMAAAASAA